MIVTIEATTETKATVQRHAAMVGKLRKAMGHAVYAAASVGADTISELTIRGELGISPQHGGQGIAGNVTAWMIDDAVPLAAVGVPSDSPAAKYAGILNSGGTILPKNSKALAVPVSEEAKRFTSPHDMANLQLIARKGRPPLLVRVVGKRKQRLEVHWVLLSSVTIPAFGWFTLGCRQARGPMITAAQDVANEYMSSFKTGQLPRRKFRRPD